MIFGWIGIDAEIFGREVKRLRLGGSGSIAEGRWDALQRFSKQQPDSPPESAPGQHSELIERSRKVVRFPQT